MNKNVLTHKIFKSNLVDKPFYHININNFLDDKTVSKLIKNYPEDKYFQKKGNYTKYDTKRKFLVLYDMHDNYFFKSKFWTNFIKKNFYIDYKNAMLEKFLPLIRKPFNHEKYYINMRIELSKDDIGYKLDPHTDDNTRLITNLIYLNEKRRPEKKIGFNILKHKNNKLNYNGKHLNDKNFKKIKTIPFARGNMLAFLISNNSYHSVEKNNIYERKSLQVAIYYKHKN
tara:strand:- start:2189 stop:2872 length:684 start_codon:yes stop_codon:yes gene_type:complete